MSILFGIPRPNRIHIHRSVTKRSLRGSVTSAPRSARVDTFVKWNFSAFGEIQSRERHSRRAKEVRNLNEYPTRKDDAHPPLASHHHGNSAAHRMELQSDGFSKILTYSIELRPYFAAKGADPVTAVAAQS